VQNDDDDDDDVLGSTEVEDAPSFHRFGER
jgi:hypothetical protein